MGVTAFSRLSEPGATHSSVAAELGVTPTQLKTWRLELEAAGSAAATAAQKAEAAELVQLRRDHLDTCGQKMPRAA